jgi:hypothetical protein
MCNIHKEAEMFFKELFYAGSCKVLEEKQGQFFTIETPVGEKYIIEFHNLDDKDTVVITYLPEDLPVPEFSTDWTEISFDSITGEINIRISKFNCEKSLSVAVSFVRWFKEWCNVRNSKINFGSSRV